jgi:hypothetical protein
MSGGRDPEWSPGRDGGGARAPLSPSGPPGATEFVRRLWGLVNAEEANGGGAAMWSPSGAAFYLDRKQTSAVLPNYFNHSK